MLECSGDLDGHGNRLDRVAMKASDGKDAFDSDFYFKKF